MKKLSKEWCEINGMPIEHSSFDMLKIANEMYLDRYYPIECMGLGTVCIHKDKQGKIWLAHTERNGYHYDWKSYEEVIAEHKK